MHHFMIAVLIMGFKTVAVQASLVNPATLRTKVGIGELVRSAPRYARLKVAVLDNGFQGYGIDYVPLPKSTQLIEGPVNRQAATAHGLRMAEIFWEITGRHPGVQLYLVNANGFSNFKAAIDFVIQEKIDIVLYSQVWSFGGNFNGTGLIDAQVSRATQTGILWINAAGNFGSQVFESSVHESVEKTLRFKNKKSKNTISITLSWNDFSAEESEATDQDLDLFILDRSGQTIASSELRQLGKIAARGTKGSSGYAREKITLPVLDQGDYRIQIKDLSKNFDVTSRLRVVIETEPMSVVFHDATPDREIFPPADHPDVITVGEDSPVSARAISGTPKGKPDLVLSPVAAIWDNGEKARGSSVSAAIFTGIATLMKMIRPEMGRKLILRHIRNTSPFFEQPVKFQTVDTDKMGLDFLTPEMKVLRSIMNGQMFLSVPYDPAEIDFQSPYQVIRSQDRGTPKLWKMPSMEQLQRL